MIWPSPSRQRLYSSLTSYLAYLSDLTRGLTQRGPEVDKFEKEIAKATKASDALAVNQARLGIYLALKYCIGPRQRKVILSPFTIFDVVNMVLCAGGVPVFVDVCPETYTLDPSLVRETLDEETAAVLVTHTHVMASGMHELRSECERYGARLIEDCAIAFGTSSEGRAIGTLGHVGIYSFGLFKNVNAVYGGAVISEDAELMSLMRAEEEQFATISARALWKRIQYGLLIDLATHPLVFKLATYWVFRAGMLGNIEFINRRTRNDPNPFRRDTLPPELRIRLSSAQAKWASRQLGMVDDHLKERVELARIYHQGLRDLPGVFAPPVNTQGEDGFVVYPIKVQNRAHVLLELMRRGRDCASYFYRNCATLSCFSDFATDCPHAEDAAQNTVLLPTYPGYGRNEALKNVTALQEILG
jgi:perosamine synthetase